MAEDTVDHKRDSHCVTTGSKYYGYIHANDNSRLILGDVNYYQDQ